MMGMTVYIIGFWYKGMKYTWSEGVGRFISPLDTTGYIKIPVGAYNLEIGRESASE